jgi:metallo-beta-lactamase class B
MGPAPAHTPCPVYKSPEIQGHIATAYRLADNDLPSTLIPGLFVIPRAAGLCAPEQVPPLNIEDTGTTAVKAFDQLYYIGNNFVGSWVLSTRDGLILIDTMYGADDAVNITEPGMRKLGLNPTDIKYIILTHGHLDHWGGAKYYQDKYHPRILMGGPDWDIAERPMQRPSRPGAHAPSEPPTHDMNITDGQTLSLGGTTVRLFITPGHTPASMAAIFAVTDRGTPHLVGLFGGNGLPTHLEKSIGPDGIETDAGLLAYIDSVKRFAALGHAAGADVAISTHPIFDGSIANAAKISHRGPNDPNPWVLGKDGWSRYMQVQLEVAETVKAMETEHPVAARGP